jgi:TRAP-type C4-dicarboxylate transport system permease small subunit
MISMLGRLANRSVEAAAVVLLLAMLGAVVLGVIYRAVGDPLVWSDELSQILLVWVGFLGWIIALRRGNHIRITTIAARLPQRLRLLLEIVIQIAIMIFAAVLIWQSWGLIRRNIDIYAVTLPLPSAVLYFPLPLLGLALITQTVADIAKAIRGETISSGAEGAGL